MDGFKNGFERGIATIGDLFPERRRTAHKSPWDCVAADFRHAGDAIREALNEAAKQPARESGK